MQSHAERVPLSSCALHLFHDSAAALRQDASETAVKGDGVADALIIGPGAVGIALAAQLAEVGLRPVFAGRDDRKTHAAPRRVVSLEIAASRRVIDLVPATSAELAAVQLVIVAVKAFDLETALAETWGALSPAVPAGAAVIPVCNGAVQEIVRAAARRAPAFTWRLGLCTFGVTAVGADRYAVRSTRGRLHWGAFVPARAPANAAERRLAGAPLCSFDLEIEPLVRRKWLFNTTLNSIAAARGLACNGDALRDATELKAVFAEAYALGAARFGSWPETRDRLYDDFLALIADTAGNENSMARDRRLGRRTESAFLAGLAVSEPDRYPRLSALDAALRAPKT
jgi:ketopantoate reductase